MKLKAIVHEAEDGGYWAEVSAIPGCATQGDTMDARQFARGGRRVSVGRSGASEAGNQLAHSANRGMRSVPGKNFARTFEQVGA